MISMTVFAMIMTSVILAVQNLIVVKVKTENRVKLLEELYFFSEQLVTSIKEWWTIDYEEYWNRQSYDPTVLSGSYRNPTGVWNYGSGWNLWTNTYGNALYYCTSYDGMSRVWTGWCLTGRNNLWSTWGTNTDVSYSGKYQRYWQYVLQFIDYNSNYDSDRGDEDGDGTIIWDEDDRDIWNWPIVLSGAIPELYLINPVEKTRVYFRHVIKQDPNTSTGCVITAGIPNQWCMGNIQVLKMRGFDLWYTHTGSASDGSAFDGKIDTWVLDPQWTGTWPSLSAWTLATGYKDEWVDLFPNSVNVKSLQFYIYPKKDPWISWDAQDCTSVSPPTCVSPFIHPYVRLQMTVGFSWGKRRVLKNDDPTISINTTVTLGDKE